jgi:hypothetical protein
MVYFKVRWVDVIIACSKVIWMEAVMACFKVTVMEITGNSHGLF